MKSIRTMKFESVMCPVWWWAYP